MQTDPRLAGNDLRIQKCISKYLQVRAEHLRAWKKDGELIPMSAMEVCWLEAGEILFELLGIPGLPTAKEVGNPGKRKRKPAAPESVQYGFVYLLKNNRSGYIKIGWSSNPHYREGTLQAQDPDVSMLAHKAGSMKYEKELHERFSDHRLRGEWFDLRGTQLQDLLSEF